MTPALQPLRRPHGGPEPPLLRRGLRPARRHGSASARPGRSRWPASRARRAGSPASCPAAGSSGWRWPAPSCTGPRSSSSTSPRAASTPSRAGASGASSTRCRPRAITVIVTTHYLDEAEHCDRIALMHAGRLVALGTVSELKRVFAGAPCSRCIAPASGEALETIGEASPGRSRRRSSAPRIHVVVDDAEDGPAARSSRPSPRPGTPRSRSSASCRRSRTSSSTTSRRRRRRGTRGRGAPREARCGRSWSKELRQVRRDPFSLLMLIALPAFMLVLYGFALNFDVRHVRLAVQDRDRSARSRELVASFTHSTYFDLVATPEPGTDLDALVERREARAVLVIPEGYARPPGGGAHGAPCSSCSTGPTRRRPRPCSATRARSSPSRTRASRCPPSRARAGARRRRSPSSRGSSSTRSSSRRSSWCRA